MFTEPICEAAFSKGGYSEKSFLDGKGSTFKKGGELIESLEKRRPFVATA